MPLIAQIIENNKERNSVDIGFVNSRINEGGNCIASTELGRCNLNTCLEQNYCHLHLRQLYKLAIGPSRTYLLSSVPSENKYNYGLFANRCIPPPILLSAKYKRVQDRYKSIGEEDEEGEEKGEEGKREEGVLRPKEAVRKYLIFRKDDIIGKSFSVVVLDDIEYKNNNQQEEIIMERNALSYIQAVHEEPEKEEEEEEESPSPSQSPSQSQSPSSSPYSSEQEEQEEQEKQNKMGKNAFPRGNVNNAAMMAAILAARAKLGVAGPVLPRPNASPASASSFSSSSKKPKKPKAQPKPKKPKVIKPKKPKLKKRKPKPKPNENEILNVYDNVTINNENQVIASRDIWQGDEILLPFTELEKVKEVVIWNTNKISKPQLNNFVGQIKETNKISTQEIDQLHKEKSEKVQQARNLADKRAIVNGKKIEKIKGALSYKEARMTNQIFRKIMQYFTEDERQLLCISKLAWKELVKAMESADNEFLEVGEGDVVEGSEDVVEGGVEGDGEVEDEYSASE